MFETLTFQRYLTSYHHQHLKSSKSPQDSKAPSGINSRIMETTPLRIPYLSRISLMFGFHLQIPNFTIRLLKKSMKREIPYKKNICRVMKHIEFFNDLPSDEIGIIRRRCKFQVMDYFPQSASEERKIKNEMEFVVKTIAQYYPNFAISSTSWGVTSDIYIPVINVILPPSSDRSIAMRVLET
jgi:hypothetical protein